MEYKNETIEKILKLYNDLTKLKTEKRSGWLYWKVKGVETESIADHVYGTIMLAFAIYSNIPIEIDINRVIMMLSLHETEEIDIGDITLFDKERLKTKKVMGKVAVDRIFENATKNSELKSIIQEFEDKKTNESIFAHQIDKLECDLQAMKYEGHYDIKNVDPKILNDDFIVGCRKNNLEKVSQFFIEDNINNFDGIFLDIANYLKNLTIKK